VNKNSMTATLVGAIVLFVAGYLIYGLALAGFYGSNAGTATGVVKEMQWLWLILSTVAYAALLAVILGWAGSTDSSSGFKTAAIVGLLMGISIDFGQYAMTNVANLTLTIVDPIVAAVHGGIGGAAIGMMLGKGSNA